MRPIIILIVSLLVAPPSYAAISTTTNFIDQNFVGVDSAIPADLDQDGDIDIVGVTAAGTQIAWWENLGTAPLTFTLRIIDAANGATDFCLADLDRDGDLDIIFTDGVNIFWYENPDKDPDPTQRADITIPWTNLHTIPTVAYAGTSIFAIDMNFDGWIDVLSTDGTDVTWWQSPADNTGIPPVIENQWPALNQRNINTNAFAGSNSVFAIDIDKDADLDVLSTAGNAVSLWINEGDPTIAGNWTSNGNNPWNIDTAFFTANSIYAVDMDKDGDIDVLSTAATGNDVSWWENDGAPNNDNWTEHTIDGNFNGADSIFVSDLDFDGDLDVMATAGTGAGALNDISWWENDGTPDNNDWTENPIDQTFNGPSFVTAADIDSDGDIDVLGAASTDNDIAWWQNDANRQSGNIGFEEELKVEDFLSSASSVYATDLDIDGDNDMVATGEIGDSVIRYESDGTPLNGGWTEHDPEELPASGGFDGPYDVVAVDLDTDGDKDIVAVAFNNDATKNDLVWWRNDGSQNFTGIELEDDFNGADSVFVIDLDIDGDLDIVATAGLRNEVAWWRNSGAEAFTKVVINTAAFGGARDVFCADLDGDGDNDVVAVADNDDQVAWWSNDGSQIFSKFIIDGNFRGARSVTVGDIDQDGDLDVVACAYNGNTVAWWGNDGTGTWIRYVIDGAASGASDVDIADIDQDGDPDVIGSMNIDDHVTWWENDGTPLDGGWTEHIIDSSFNGATSSLVIDLDRDGELDVVSAAVDGYDVSWWPNGGAEAVPDPQNLPGELGSIGDAFQVKAPASTVSDPIDLSSLGSESGEEEDEGDLREIDVKCFIATAAFGAKQSGKIERLCRFRDVHLLSTQPGKVLVESYYRISPPLSRYIKRKPLFKAAVRGFIRTILAALDI
ncbi:MAG: VCBS repeat-containing protein [Candidatus Omnitrophota bacterium]